MLLRTPPGSPRAIRDTDGVCALRRRVRRCFALALSAGALVFLAMGRQPADAAGGIDPEIIAVAGTAVPTVEFLAAAFVSQDQESVAVDAGTVGRWLSYLAVFVMIGTLAFGPIAARAFRTRDAICTEVHGPAISMSKTLGLAGSILFLIAAGIRLNAQVVSMLFPGDPVTLGEFSTIAFDTTWGTRWLFQVSAALVAGVGFATARLGWRVGGWLGSVGAVTTGVALPLTGHAMAASWHWGITLPLQAGHVLAGAVWLGSLLVLTIVGFRVTADRDDEVREEAVARLIGAFSPVAVAGVLLVVSFGIVLSVSYVGSWAALWQTTYGRTLSIKILLLAGTGLVGAYNWRRLRPQLGMAGSAAKLRFSARVELLLGGILLVVTAILVALPAPHG